MGIENSIKLISFSLLFPCNLAHYTHRYNMCHVQLRCAGIVEVFLNNFAEISWMRSVHRVKLIHAKCLYVIFFSLRQALRHLFDELLRIIGSSTTLAE